MQTATVHEEGGEDCEEKVGQADKILILEEAMAQLWGKKHAKALLGAIQEKKQKHSRRGEGEE